MAGFIWNRTVDDKPKRPTRKRQAPEDFLGKGPDRKIFMGKYVSVPNSVSVWQRNQVSFQYLFLKYQVLSLY